MADDPLWLRLLLGGVLAAYVLSLLLLLALVS